MEEDLFDVAQAVPDFGPVLTATRDGDCAACGREIEADNDHIRADGRGGWIHADQECERKSRS